LINGVIGLIRSIFSDFSGIGSGRNFMTGSEDECLSEEIIKDLVSILPVRSPSRARDPAPSIFNAIGFVFSIFHTNLPPALFERGFQ
jgi:hypothetical protein